MADIRILREISSGELCGDCDAEVVVVVDEESLELEVICDCSRVAALA